jgi:hypothetical protein
MDQSHLEFLTGGGQFLDAPSIDSESRGYLAFRSIHKVVSRAIDANFGWVELEGLLNVRVLA